MNALPAAWPNARSVRTDVKHCTYIDVSVQETYRGNSLPERQLKKLIHRRSICGSIGSVVLVLAVSSREHKSFGALMGRFLDVGKGLAVAGALAEAIVVSPVAGMTPAQISELAQSSGLSQAASHALSETVTEVRDAVQETTKGVQEAEDNIDTEPVEEPDYSEQREAEQNNIIDAIEWDVEELSTVEIEDSSDFEIFDTSEITGDLSSPPEEGFEGSEGAAI